jgi:hypothetical protein
MPAHHNQHLHTDSEKSESTPARFSFRRSVLAWFTIAISQTADGPLALVGPTGSLMWTAARRPGTGPVAEAGSEGLIRVPPVVERHVAEQRVPQSRISPVPAPVRQNA